MNPLRDPRCGCPDVTDLLRHELSGTALAPCCLHDEPIDREAEARDAALERLIAESRAATSAADQRANPPPTLAELVGCLLAGDAPKGPGLAPVIPLNAPASAFPALAGLNTDPPPTAA